MWRLIKDDNEATIVQENFQKHFSLWHYGFPEHVQAYVKQDKNRVKPLHFLTRGRVGGVRNKSRIPTLAHNLSYVATKI